jgi:hypothetical protein
MTEPIERLKNKIITYQNLGDRGYETNTTAIANILLELSGKTFLNGYIIRDESILKAIQVNVISILQEKRPDKTVHKEVERPVRDSVIFNEKPIMVIECKHHNSIKDFNDDDYNQLQQYMLGANFPIGILLSEFKAVTLKLIPGRVSNFVEDRVFLLPQDTSECISYIQLA